MQNVTVGCRVNNAIALDAELQRAGLGKAQHPCFQQIAGAPAAWTMTAGRCTIYSVADLVIGCQEGYIAGTNPMEDEGLFRVLTLRSGPISAAISINLDAPE